MISCGYVQFKDGHKESIILHHAFPDGSAIFMTENDRYLYKKALENLEGFKVLHNCFMHVESTNDSVDECIEIDTIEMVNLYPEESHKFA